MLALFSLALVSADVSHLFGHEHDHHHEEHAHPGYNYEPPQIPFELPTAAPKATYLPPAPPKPTYLPPPPPPKPVYLPPAQPKKEYIPPVVEEVASLPIEQPENNYLPPAPLPVVVPSPVPVSLPTYKIPIPSYAAPLEPENSYLPPQEIIEPHSDDGYRYNAPATPFFY